MICDKTIRDPETIHRRDRFAAHGFTPNQYRTALPDSLLTGRFYCKPFGTAHHRLRYYRFDCKPFGTQPHRTHLDTNLFLPHEFVLKPPQPPSQFRFIQNLSVYSEKHGRSLVWLQTIQDAILRNFRQVQWFAKNCFRIDLISNDSMNDFCRRHEPYSRFVLSQTFQSIIFPCHPPPFHPIRFTAN